MTAFAPFQAEARQAALAIRGIVADRDHPDHTILLLGPDEPAFWPVFSAAPEYADGQPDPMDRWSRRVIGALARAWGGVALFPSDGPPYPPFLAWALDSGRAWASPVGMLVHDETGLFLSFRGAVRLPRPAPRLVPAAPPCTTCTAPCTTACPVGALGAATGYDVARCKAHLASPQGTPCREGGCLARRACPVSARFGRVAAQSAFHMAAFMGDT